MQSTATNDVAVEYQDAGECHCKRIIDPKREFRITFYESVFGTGRIEPLEFAWLVSLHELDVVAKLDGKPVLIVRARKEEDVIAFMNDVNRHYGPMIFSEVERRGADCEWESIWGDSPSAEAGATAGKAAPADEISCRGAIVGSGYTHAVVRRSGMALDVQDLYKDGLEAESMCKVLNDMSAQARADGEPYSVARIV